MLRDCDIVRNWWALLLDYLLAVIGWNGCSIIFSRNIGLSVLNSHGILFSHSLYGKFDMVKNRWFLVEDQDEENLDITCWPWLVNF